MIGHDDNKITMYLDNLLPKLVIAAVCCLLVVQVILFIDGTRQYISHIDQLEGEQIVRNPRTKAPEDTVRAVLEPLQKLRKGKTVSLKVISGEKRPNIFVRVNNQVAGNFQSGPVVLSVYEQDYLEIDARQWPEPVRLRLETEPGILLPLGGVELTIEGDTLPIGQVKLK